MVLVVPFVWYCIFIASDALFKAVYVTILPFSIAGLHTRVAAHSSLVTMRPPQIPTRVPAAKVAQEDSPSLASLVVDLGGNEIRAERLSLCRGPDGQPQIVGSGGYGVVYKALYNGHMPVAVKIAPNAAGRRQEGKVWFCSGSDDNKNDDDDGSNGWYCYYQ